MPSALIMARYHLLVIIGAAVCVLSAWPQPVRAAATGSTTAASTADNVLMRMPSSHATASASSGMLGGSPAPGQTLQLYPCAAGSPLQTWSYNAVNHTFALAAATSTITSTTTSTSGDEPDAAVQAAAGSQLCVTNDGYALVLAACSSSTAVQPQQTWFYNATGSMYITSTNTSSGSGSECVAFNAQPPNGPPLVPNTTGE